MQSKVTVAIIYDPLPEIAQHFPIVPDLPGLDTTVRCSSFVFVSPSLYMCSLSDWVCSHRRCQTTILFPGAMVV